MSNVNSKEIELANIRQVKTVDGELKYNRIFELTINDLGTENNNIDFSGYTFDVGRNYISRITIINDGGSNDVFFVFDSDGDTIDTADSATYNGKCYPGSPYNEISLDGIASSVGFRCASGLSTTVKVLVW